MSLDLTSIIMEAARRRASDIHIVPGFPLTFRVFGNLQHFSTDKVTPEDLERFVHEMASKRHQEEIRKSQDSDFSFSVNEVRVRVNAHVQRGQLALAMRLVSRDVPSIETLGLPSILRKLSDLSQGLILITGPTGSGKSTTQAAMIRHILEKRACHVISIEDPIEYDFERLPIKKGGIVEQREVGADTPTFCSALRHVLRQDPDVILIGEMRDYETISIALTAAETGHLVISTLHTQDASQSVDRMIDVFPSDQQAQVRTQLSLALEGVCAQRIFPRLDGAGAVVGMEIMIATPGIRNLIRSAKTAEIYSMIELGKESGMQSLDDAIETLVARKLVSLETVKRHVRKAERFFRDGTSSKGRLAQKPIR